MQPCWRKSIVQGQLWGNIASPLPVLSLSASWVHTKYSQPSSDSCHHARPGRTIPAGTDSIPLEPRAKMDPSFLHFFWLWYFLTAKKKVIRHLPRFATWELSHTHLNFSFNSETNIHSSSKPPGAPSFDTVRKKTKLSPRCLPPKASQKLKKNGNAFCLAFLFAEPRALHLPGDALPLSYSLAFSFSAGSHQVVWTDLELTTLLDISSGLRLQAWPLTIGKLVSDRDHFGMPSPNNPVIAGRPSPHVSQILLMQ